MDARRPREVVPVWPPPQLRGPEGETRHCPHADPDQCDCAATGLVPAYYLTATPDGRAICEDQRLWANWRHYRCWAIREGLLDDSADDTPPLTGFALARAELAERRASIRREWLELVRLAGEPAEPVYSDEVIPLVDEVRYCLAAFRDAVQQSMRARRRREQVRRFPPRKFRGFS